MWAVVMFDLPVTCTEQRREYRRFHDALEDLGFTRMQFSIYGRACASPENATYYVSRVKEELPPEGEVRVIQFTALQFSRMEIFLGGKPAPPEQPPPQISLF